MGFKSRVAGVVLALGLGVFGQDSTLDRTPTLSWPAAGGGSTAYKIEIDTNVGFASPLVQDYVYGTVVSGGGFVLPATYTPAVILPFGWNFWRVASDLDYAAFFYQDSIKIIAPTAPVESSLVAYFPFTSSADDASGTGNNGTVHGATLTTDRQGNADRAFLFSGTSYIEVPYDTTLDNPQAFTVSVWAKSSIPGSSYTADGFIWDLRTVGNNGYGLRANPVTDGMDGYCSNAQTIVDTKALDTAWHHYVLWSNGGSAKLYVDGVVTTAKGRVPSPIDNSPLRIGAQSKSLARYWNGKIDEFRMYNYALGDSAIDALYGGGAAAGSLVAYYPFTGNAGDSSGNGNHGTVSGAVLAADRNSQAGAAYSFDGVDDLINCGTGSSLKINGNKISISAWVNIQGNGTEWPRIVLGGGVNAVYTLTKCDGADDRLLWRPCLAGQSISVGQLYSSTPLSRNAWHHVAAIYDGSSSRLYVDGVQSAAVSGIGGNLAVDANPVLIGGEHGTTLNSAWRGLLDEVRIYSYALSDSEIAALYSGQPAPADSVPRLITYTPDPTSQRRPVLAWNAVSGVLNYKVQIDTVAIFNSPPLFSGYAGASASFAVPVDLPYRKIFWRVSTNLDYTKYSAADSFTVVQVPQPVSLADSTSNRKPAFRWHPVAGVTSYKICLGGATADTVQVDGDTAYTPTAFLGLGAVTWKVSRAPYYSLYATPETVQVLSFAAPAPVKPAEMAAVNQNDSLAWSASPDPSATVWYDLVISTLDDFSGDTVVYADSLAANAVRILDLPEYASIPGATLLFWRVRAHNSWGLVSGYSATRSFTLTRTTGLEAPAAVLVNALAASPNPFNPAVQIRYCFKESGPVNLGVYNIHGELVKILDRGSRPAGWRLVAWDGTDRWNRPLPTGFYLVKFQAKGFSKIERVLLMK